MTTLREAAQQFVSDYENGDLGDLKHYARAIRAALAQQEQEPVAWGVDWGRDGDQSCCTIIKRHADGTQEVVAVEYGSPRREWQSLSEEEIQSIHDTYHKRMGPQEFARAIEAKLKEKNQ